MLECVLEHSAAVHEGPFFSGGCLSDRINLQSHQRQQVGLSTGAEGLGLTSTSKRRLSTSIGSLARMLPKILADPSGPIEGRLWAGLPAVLMIGAMGEALSCLADEGEVQIAQYATVIPTGSSDGDKRR